MLEQDKRSDKQCCDIYFSRFVQWAAWRMSWDLSQLILRAAHCALLCKFVPELQKQVSMLRVGGVTSSRHLIDQTPWPMIQACNWAERLFKESEKLDNANDFLMLIHRIDTTLHPASLTCSWRNYSDKWVGKIWALWRSGNLPDRHKVPVFSNWREGWEHAASTIAVKIPETSLNWSWGVYIFTGIIIAFRDSEQIILWGVLLWLPNCYSWEAKAAVTFAWQSDDCLMAT